MANLFNVEFRLSRLIMNPFLEDTCIIMENSGYKNHSLNIFSENSSLLHGNVLFSSKNMAVYKTLVLLLESPIFFCEKIQTGICMYAFSFQSKVEWFIVGKCTQNGFLFLDIIYNMIDFDEFQQKNSAIYSFS